MSTTEQQSKLQMNYTIFCDDVRLEVGNKLSLMGVFHQIAVHQFPVTVLKFAVVSQWCGRGRHLSEVRILAATDAVGRAGGSSSAGSIGAAARETESPVRQWHSSRARRCHLTRRRLLQLDRQRNRSLPETNFQRQPRRPEYRRRRVHPLPHLHNR